MIGHISKDEVHARLTPEAVAEQYGIAGRWSGRWMRSKRCATATHGTDAFGLSKDGKWHCHGCNIGGGDLLSLVALAEGLDCRTQFQEVLEVAAAICGVEPESDFGEGPKQLRKPIQRKADPIAPIADRVVVARRRCEWTWSHLKMSDRVYESGRHWYLESRGISWAKLPHHAQINVRDLGFWTVPDDYRKLADTEGDSITGSIRRIYNTMGVGVCVRHVDTGDLTDIRARRAEPEEGEPKILGMVGGVTVDGNDLIACYGNPHCLAAGVVIVVEGWADYLTACMRWPKADVLGAVDANSYPLVASFGARYLAERGAGRIVLVAQDDGAGKAADRAVNMASKRAIGLLGPDAVSWIEAADYWVKDINDLARDGRLAELPELK